MELRPGTYFEMDGKAYEFAGVQHDEKENLVLRIAADSPSEGLHQVFSAHDVEEKARNFWDLGEALSHQEFVRQYREQVAILEQTGVVEQLSDGKLGYSGIEGEYTVPSLEEVRKRLLSRQHELREKIAQGFTQLLLVPIGKPVNDMLDVVGSQLVQVNGEGKLRSSARTQPAVWVRLSVSNPIQTNVENDDINNEIIYYPMQWERNHHGKTKQQLLEDVKRQGSPGWNILLVEPVSIVPSINEGITKAGRGQIEPGGTIEDVLMGIYSYEGYKHETGMSLDDWLMLAILKLKTTKEILDVSTNGNIKEVVLPGTMLVSTLWVSRVQWAPGEGLVFDYINIHNTGYRSGLRTVVRV